MSPQQFLDSTRLRWDVGFSKFPVDSAEGVAFGLPLLAWWVVCYGEIAAGAGLLMGALATIPRLRDIPLSLFGNTAASLAIK